MKRDRIQKKRKRGQSTVEFALISFFLFFLLLGIIEMGRFLFVYSVISNAAQEGSRYGIVRPRDAVPNYAVVYQNIGGVTVPTYLGTPIPTQLVVSAGLCDVISKTREKVWGVNKDDVGVSVWYDKGDGTPVVVTSNPTDPNFYDAVISPGNRVVVQAAYTYYLMVPFFQVFAPNGITLTMTSARTMLNNGTEPMTYCTNSYTPGPTRTPTITPNVPATNTAAAATRTAIAAATNTALAQTSTAIAGATNTAAAAATNTAAAAATSTAIAGATNTAMAGGTNTAIAAATNTALAQTSTAIAGATNTAMAAATNTAAAAATNTAVAATRTALVTPTPARKLVISQIAGLLANATSSRLDISAVVKDDLGNLINTATVSVTASQSTTSWSGTLPSVGGGTYRICDQGSFDGTKASTITITVNATASGYQPAATGTASASNGNMLGCP